MDQEGPVDLAEQVDLVALVDHRCLEGLDNLEVSIFRCYIK